MTSKANLNYQLDAPLAFTRTLFNFAPYEKSKAADIMYKLD